MDDEFKPAPGSFWDKISKSEAQKKEAQAGNSGDKSGGHRDNRKQTLVLQSNQLHFARQLAFDADATLLKQELERVEQEKATRLQEEKEARDRAERRRYEDRKKEEQRVAVAQHVQEQIQREKDEKEKELEMDKAVV